MLLGEYTCISRRRDGDSAFSFPLIRGKSVDVSDQVVWRKEIIPAGFFELEGALAENRVT
jgi:hypothetical protein